MEINMMDDKKNGKVLMFYPNGNLKNESNYFDDKMNGINKSYHENGKLKSEDSFKNGKLNGLCKEYNENGIIESECFFVNDSPHGVFKLYYPSGKLKQNSFLDTSSLHTNKLIGDLYLYYEDGTLGSHKYIDKNGYEVDKTPKKQSSKLTITSPELKKPYKCKCCKAIINGVTDAVNKEGDQCNELNLGMLINGWNAFNISKEIDYYNLIRVEYPYCSLNCFKTCN
jgi:antitoxin component YwqK of YwqJK toxin-antitoxin module